MHFGKPSGEQERLHFAQLQVRITHVPLQSRIVLLFSMVLDCSRLIWPRFVTHQNFVTVLHCRVAALEAMKRCPYDILCDRMRIVVSGEKTSALLTIVRWLTWAAVMTFFRGLAGRVA